MAALFQRSASGGFVQVVAEQLAKVDAFVFEKFGYLVCLNGSLFGFALDLRFRMLVVGVRCNFLKVE